jgi:hypothetical protein
MDLVTAATIIAASVPFSALLMKIAGGGVSQREFDNFREEVRDKFKELRDDIRGLA